MITHKIESCPLIAILRDGNIMLFNHNVIVENNIFTAVLTSESVAKISAELFKKGYDIVHLSIDKSRIKYQEVDLI